MDSNATKQSVEVEMSSVDKHPIVHLETTSSLNSQVREEVRQVTDLTAKEQYRKLWTAIKADKRFVWWTLYVMLLVFSWGYDAGLSGVAIAFPEFREYYGNYYADGSQYVIPALWQSLWNAASTIGQVFGGYAAGQFADVTGRKPLLYLAVALSLASSFALVFAPNLPVLFVSKLLLGLSVGLSTAIPPLYVTENAPSHLRSTASSLTNIIIVFGFFASSMTGFGASKIHGEWSFRLAFCMTFAMPALFLIGMPFFPESPVWFMKKGREADARKAVLKLFGADTDVEERINILKTELKQSEEESDGKMVQGDYLLNASIDIDPDSGHSTPGFSPCKCIAAQSSHSMFHTFQSTAGHRQATGEGDFAGKPTRSNGSRRISTSNACVECRRRKIRCDGSQPCGQCQWYQHPEVSLRPSFNSCLFDHI